MWEKGGPGGGTVREVQVERGGESMEGEGAKVKAMWVKGGGGMKCELEMGGGVGWEGGR
jgi:hypothetical protein